MIRSNDINIHTYVLVLCLCLLSCKRIPLYDPQSDVLLKLDLQLNTEVTLNDDIDLDGNPDLSRKVYGTMPQTVRVCFYDTQTHALVTEEFLPPQGGFIDVAAGTYDILVYSLGNEVTRVESTETRAGGRAFTSNVGQTLKVTKSGSTKAMDFNVIYEPDHLFVGRKEAVQIPVHASIDRTVVIEMPMRTLLETYSFEVRNIQGAENIASTDVYITGQASSKYLWDGRYPLTPCAIYFPAVLNVDKGHIYTVFNTFGKIPGIESDVLLNVIVGTTSGGKYQWIFDVTPQFDNPDNTHHEIIIDEPVVIPEDGSGGGFSAEVHPWESEIIPIEL